MIRAITGISLTSYRMLHLTQFNALTNHLPSVSSHGLPVQTPFPVHWLTLGSFNWLITRQGKVPSEPKLTFRRPSLLLQSSLLQSEVTQRQNKLKVPVDLNLMDQPAERTLENCPKDTSKMYKYLLSATDALAIKGKPVQSSTSFPGFICH